MPDDEKPPLGALYASSLYGQKTRTGRVNLFRLANAEIGGEPVWHEQVSIDEARSFAMNILQAAEAAETDECVATWLRDDVKIDSEEKLIRTLVALRKVREARRE